VNRRVHILKDAARLAEKVKTKFGEMGNALQINLDAVCAMLVQVGNLAGE